MRIIAGKYGGLSINTLKGDVARPTTDRVKEAMFSTITSIVDLGVGSGHLTSGASDLHKDTSVSYVCASDLPVGTPKNTCVLDTFAGSGSLGIEALSRGFSTCVFCDIEKRMLNNVKVNCNKVCAADRTFFLNNDVFDKHFVKTLTNTCQFNDMKFSLVLLDPPYKVVFDKVFQLVKDIKDANLCNDKCLFVYEHSSKNLLEEDQFAAYNLRLVKVRKYGDTIIEYFE